MKKRIQLENTSGNIFAVLAEVKRVTGEDLGNKIQVLDTDRYSDIIDKISQFVELAIGTLVYSEDTRKQFINQLQIQ